jgi:hypothetical protein
VFDNLAKAPITVLDLRAGLLSKTLQRLSDIGLLEAVKAARIRLTLLHILGSSVASFQEIAGTSAVLAGGKHYLVKNHVNEATFFSWSSDAAEALKMGSGIINVPKLDELAMEHVETLGVPFSAYNENPDNSMVLRGLVRNWLRAVYAQLDTVLAE